MKTRYFWVKVWQAEDFNEPWVSGEFNVETTNDKMPTVEEIKDVCGFNEFDSGYTVEECIARPSCDYIQDERLKDYFTRGEK